MQIDRGDIRQAIDRCSNIWASLPGYYGQFEHKADSLIAKFKEAGGTVEMMYEQSHCDYSALVICIIVCLSWAVNHYRDNAITMCLRRTKCQRTAGERGNYRHGCVSGRCCAHVKQHEGGQLTSWK